MGKEVNNKGYESDFRHGIDGMLIFRETIKRWNWKDDGDVVKHLLLALEEFSSLHPVAPAQLIPFSSPLQLRQLPLPTNECLRKPSHEASL